MTRRQAVVTSESSSSSDSEATVSASILRSPGPVSIFLHSSLSFLSSLLKTNPSLQAGGQETENPVQEVESAPVHREPEQQAEPIPNPAPSTVHQVS